MSSAFQCILKLDNCHYSVKENTEPDIDIDVLIVLILNLLLFKEVNFLFMIYLISDMIAKKPF